MFIDQKAQEISLALIKVSVYVRRPEFRHRLERLAFELLESVVARDFGVVRRTTSILDGLIKFGRTIYEIEPVNADILVGELDNLNKGIDQIAELGPSDLEKTPSIQGIFSRPSTLFEAVKFEKKANKMWKTKENPAIQSGNNPAAHSTSSGQANPAIQHNPATLRQAQAKPANESGNLEDNPAKRESAIIEKIRQSGDKPVQFKDIIAAFPDFSERTLRYDIQRLCNRGVLERLGPGGPATYYKMRVI